MTKTVLNDYMLIFLQISVCTFVGNKRHSSLSNGIRFRLR